MFSAKVLDRAADGSAVLRLYIYPSVVLDSGEAGSCTSASLAAIQSGQRTKKVDLGDGVSKQETVYEEDESGFIFSIKYELGEDGAITYNGKGTSKRALGTSGDNTITKSSEIIFHGRSRARRNRRSRI